MKWIRARLPLTLVLLLSVSFLGTAFLIGHQVYMHDVDLTKEKLASEGQLISALLEQQTLEESIDVDIQSIVAIYNDEGVSERVIHPESHSDDNLPVLPSEFLAETNQGEYGNFLYTLDPIRGDRYLFVGTPVDEVRQRAEQLWWLLGLSLGATLIVIGMVASRVTRHYAKPVEAAASVAKELARGNYNARTYEQYQDEPGSVLSQSINTLARNLKQMVDSQEMQKDRLRTLIESMGSSLLLIDRKGYVNLMNRAYKDTFQADETRMLSRLYYEVLEHKKVIQLIEDIFMTEKSVRQQMRLSMAIERRHFEVYGTPIIGETEEWKGIVLVFHDITDLKKLENTRKDFVANVSHELKTPITSIRGFTETLLDGAGQDEQLREHFLSIILKESERLQSLVHDLLDLSRIEQDGFPLHLSDVDLVYIVKDTIESLSNKAGKKDIELIDEWSTESSVFIQADSLRMKQVIYNLINNAIAYTPDGGQVKVALQRKDNGAQIVVVDTGIGIHAKEVPRIFERFYRVDKDRSRNSGGTGLGLAIVKHLVEAHHGQIQVESEPDKGTTFTVWLPRKFT
ncbi:cell wall metabolism sensor histidine kinase WalK [Bacillaceae bacterium SIJ1]|uniref:two-component system histidine kinase PnpS n=1 Tax=Litoribacterium kuwaitense TaxID=1398745 RepID=UPI0013EB8BFC|nr:HAMP domain-containing sensor histidine kinase [Litoribacterium kuwaitense]NGP45021.1 cell wall metabolism sensor histidine kinase WalK [Litoribacterium kuwaitense]